MAHTKTAAGPSGLEVASSLAMAMGADPLAVDAMATACAAVARNVAQELLGQQGKGRSASELLAEGLRRAMLSMEEQVAQQLEDMGLKGSTTAATGEKPVRLPPQTAEEAECRQQGSAVYASPETPPGVSAGANEVAEQALEFSMSHVSDPTHIEVPMPGMVPMPSTGGTSTVAPLSLAEALGLPRGHGAGRAAHSSPEPAYVQPRASAPQVTQKRMFSGSAIREEEDEEVSRFTIRVADGAELGLLLDPSSMASRSGLRVDGVKPGSALEAWNRQCGSSGAPEKVLLRGDRIVRVNSATSAGEMLRECQSCRLLRLSVVHSQGSQGSTGNQEHSPQALWSLPGMPIAVTPQSRIFQLL